MAFRGRGFGRGFGRGGGGGYRLSKQQKFELFPGLPEKENVSNDNSKEKVHDANSKSKGGANGVELENFPNANNVKLETALVVWGSRLQSFWNSSAYYLEDEGPKKEESIDIERYSDRGKKRSRQKHKLTDFIKCSVEYVPAELAQDSKLGRRDVKKPRWNQESGLQKLDLFEKLEQKYQGQDEKGGKGKQEGENEEEDNERLEEEDEEFSDDGDYNQNIDFDDDEDDFNMADDNDDEGTF